MDVKIWQGRHAAEGSVQNMLMTVSDRMEYRQARQ